MICELFMVHEIIRIYSMLHLVFMNLCEKMIYIVFLVKFFVDSVVWILISKSDVLQGKR